MCASVSEIVYLVLCPVLVARGRAEVGPLLLHGLRQGIALVAQGPQALELPHHLLHTSQPRKTAAAGGKMRWGGGAGRMQRTGRRTGAAIATLRKAEID